MADADGTGSLLGPGETLFHDYRGEAPDIPTSGALRVVCWNIERGLQRNAILSELKRLRPHIVLLQEVDIGCGRTDGVDIGAFLAKELGMAYYFVCEFVEFDSPKRSARVGAGGGVHGNAVLSVLDFASTDVIEHAVQPFDWEKNGAWLRGEPREGGRVVAVAELVLPAHLARGDATTALVYSVHLEDGTGVCGRVAQFADVLKALPASRDDAQLQIVGGDLNTLTHGVARLRPWSWRDALSLWTLGRSEAQVWQDELFDAPPGEDVPLFAQRGVRVCNVAPPLRDPFNKNRDVTLTGLGGLYAGKLDWVLARGALQPVHHALGGAHASDHAWLEVHYDHVAEEEAEEENSVQDEEEEENSVQDEEEDENSVDDATDEEAEAEARAQARAQARAAARAEEEERGEELCNYAAEGKLDACAAALDAGANVNFCDWNNCTPLHHAASGGHARVCTLLLARGADVTRCDSDGGTPLLYAASNGQHHVSNVEAAAVLVQSGADLHARGMEAWAPLHMACFVGDSDVARFLLEQGADRTLVDDSGLTALELAHAVHAQCTPEQRTALEGVFADVTTTPRKKRRTGTQ